MESARRVPADKRLRQRLRQQIGWGRMAMLAILAVSLINQFLLLIKVNYHFLFSAAIPYYLNWLSRELGAYANVGAFKALAVVLTLLVYAAYIVCWLLSAQRREWLTAALGLYGLDTLMLIIFSFTLLENPASCLLEILTHCIGLFLLFNAVQAAQRLSRLPKPRRTPGGQREQAREENTPVS